MKKILIIVAVILVIIIGLNMMKSGKVNTLKDAKLQMQKSVSESDKVIPVKILVVSANSFTAELKNVGTIKAKEDYVLSAKANGQITYLNAEIGSRIGAGSVVAMIEPDMADATLKQAQANFELVNSNYKRQMNLAQQKLVSDQQLEAAMTQYKVAESSLRLARINYNNSRIASPINGEIAEKYTSLYETISAGRPVVRVVNNNRLEVAVGVNEKNISRIKKGNEVYVRFSSYAGLVITANIKNIGMQGNQDTKTFPVIVQFNNQNGQIKGGMIAQVNIKLDTYLDAIVIPFYLLEQANNGYYVYVEQDGFAQSRKVEIGEIQGDQVHITAGLVTGDHLIIDGYKYVSDGAKVNIEQ